MITSGALPIGNQPQVVSFGMVPAGVVCSVSSDGPVASGTLVGTCLDVVGYGSMTNGHPFVVTGSHGVLVFGGGVTGGTSWTVNLFGGAGCWEFILSGAMALSHPLEER